MSVAATVFTAVLGTVGCLFVSAGTVGLLRFGDLRSRLHALTKADTLGLGCIVLGLLPHAGSVAAAGKLLLVWVLAQASATVVAHLLARGADRDGTARPISAQAAPGRPPAVPGPAADPGR